MPCQCCGLKFAPRFVVCGLHLVHAGGAAADFAPGLCYFYIGWMNDLTVVHFGQLIFGSGFLPASFVQVIVYN